jgi:hypothetical protein
MPHTLRLIPHGTATSSTAYRQPHSTPNRNRYSSLFPQNAVSRFSPSSFPNTKTCRTPILLRRNLFLNISSNTTAQAALRSLGLAQHFSTRAVAFFTGHVTYSMLNAIHRFWIWIYAPRNGANLSKSKMFRQVQFCALTRQNLADVTEIQFFTQPESLMYQPGMSYFDL